MKKTIACVCLIASIVACYAVGSRVSAEDVWDDHGVCCYADGTCAFFPAGYLNQANCEYEPIPGAGGVWHPLVVNCETTNCQMDFPTGQCCLHWSDGSESCQNLTNYACHLMKGTTEEGRGTCVGWQWIVFGSCGDGWCKNVGKCLVPCSVGGTVRCKALTTQYQCDVLGGTWDDSDHSACEFVEWALPCGACCLLEPGPTIYDPPVYTCYNDYTRHECRLLSNAVGAHSWTHYPGEDCGTADCPTTLAGMAALGWGA